MSEFARGYEECRSDLTAWSKARAKATGDRISLDLIHEFYVFMAQREVEHAEELKRYAGRLRPRLVEAAP